MNQIKGMPQYYQPAEPQGDEISVHLEAKDPQATPIEVRPARAPEAARAVYWKSGTQKGTKDAVG